MKAGHHYRMLEGKEREEKNMTPRFWTWVAGGGGGAI